MKTTIYDTRGRRVEAKTVFAYSIKFLGDEAVNLIRQEAEADDFRVEDIQWVLTVPAIWTPRAKQFMREAAYEVFISFFIFQIPDIYATIYVKNIILKKGGALNETTVFIVITSFQKGDGSFCFQLIKTSPSENDR